MHTRRILGLESHQSGVVWSPAKAERNICSGDGASSLERHYQGDFTIPSAQALDHCLDDLLDEIYFVVEQSGLGYGSGDNGDLEGRQPTSVASL